MPLNNSDSKPPSKLLINLYKPTTAFSFPIDSLAQFIEDLLGERLEDGFVQVREEFIQNFIISTEDLAIKKHASELLANCRIDDIKTEELPVESGGNKVKIFYAALELNMLDGVPPKRSRSYLYHGPKLMDTFRKFLPDHEKTIDHVHIIFTDRLFCTWNFSDARYHARLVMLGFPHLISMPGIVEAPARPREYYIKRHLYASSGLSADELEAEFSGQYVIYKDARTLEVLKGIILQSLFYTLFKDPFCTDPSCRLYNAHWQSELLQAQIESGKLCKRHKKMLGDYVNSGSND